MVGRPSMIPSVGETIRSICTPNGSMPTAASSSRTARTAFSLEFSFMRFLPVQFWISDATTLTRSGVLACGLLDHRGEVAHGPYLGQRVDGHGDIELILDGDHEVHDSQRVQPQLAGDSGVLGDLRHATFCDRGDEFDKLRNNILVIHQGTP